MGKYSASGVEIIPIKDTQSSNSNSNTEMNSTEMQRIPYLSDPTIVPRVQKYLETNVDKTYVDINVMADDLQQKYREYARRKRSAFRASVKKAYSIVLRSYGISDPDPDDSSSEEALSDDSEEEDKAENSMNNQIQDMCRRSVVPKQIDENELIDISSDDSEENIEPPSRRPNNGAPTSYPSALTQQPSQLQNSNKNGISQAKTETTLSAPSLIDRGRKRKAGYESPYQSTSKKKKCITGLQESTITFDNIGGMAETLVTVCDMMMHIVYPDIYKARQATTARAFLLHGPPGCGKTLLANAIAGEFRIPLLKVTGPQLVTGVSGESEKLVRELFEQAVSSSPCIIFIDEIDSVTTSRENTDRGMERRIVAQLISCLDDLSANENGDRVFVIGATSRPDSIDPALRIPGRFENEICLGIPNMQSREQILRLLTSKLQLSPDIDFVSLAKQTPGFVGADLKSLVAKATSFSIQRDLGELYQRWKLKAKAIEESNKEKENDSNKASDKSDPEIIVDDEVEVTKPDETFKVPTTVDTNSSDSAVVVIDDDVKNPAEQSDETIEAVAIEKTEVAESPMQEPVIIDASQLKLKERRSLISNRLPMNEANLSSAITTVEDFARALKSVQPSAKREGFATVPDVTWEDVGALRDIRTQLQSKILRPVSNGDLYKKFGLKNSSGVLLCGPPGCGKTLIAKAIANEANINFISVKGPELLNMYVGASEKAIRECFQRARNSAPCVIFFDELDSLCPKRYDSKEGGATRVVNQMLTEMDGFDSRQDVYILAATNRPDIIDPALLRFGRFDKILYVGLPIATDRVDILRALTKNGTKPPLAQDVDLQVIGESEQCKGYSGADLAALVNEAAQQAVSDHFIAGSSDPPPVNNEHFNRAIRIVKPSVSEKELKHYEQFRRMYSAVPEQNEVEEMEYS